jgi:hypothetical protein
VPAALWYQTVRVVKGLIPKLDVVRERMDPAPSGDVVVFRPAGSGNFARRVLGGFRCRDEVANASSALWVGPGLEIIAGSSTKTEFGDIVASKSPPRLGSPGNGRAMLPRISSLTWGQGALSPRIRY